MSQFHQSVLLREVIDYLDVEPENRYIDATVGGGGHAIGILKRGGRVLGIDRDPEAIKHLKKSQKSKVKSHPFDELRMTLSSPKGQKLTLVRGNFVNVGEIAREHGFSRVSGIVFDLGVSSHQLEKPQRGFSFIKEGPLDMRMDPEGAITAADLINNLDKRRLNEIFKTYGQEKLSWPITNAIFSTRQIKPIKTTAELSRLIEKVYQGKGLKTKLHPATKIFLALRIVVNSEILNLKEVLPQTVDLLKKGGRLAVISFHSLEDGEVKRFFKREVRIKVLTKKPVVPGAQEILRNPRSRSAKLRIAEKI